MSSQKSHFHRRTSSSLPSFLPCSASLESKKEILVGHVTVNVNLFPRRFPEELIYPDDFLMHFVNWVGKRDKASHMSCQATRVRTSCCKKFMTGNGCSVQALFHLLCETFCSHSVDVKNSRAVGLKWVPEIACALTIRQLRCLINVM